MNINNYLRQLLTSEINNQKFKGIQIILKKKFIVELQNHLRNEDDTILIKFVIEQISVAYKQMFEVQNDDKFYPFSSYLASLESGNGNNIHLHLFVYFMKNYDHEAQLTLLNQKRSVPIKKPVRYIRTQLNKLNPIFKSSQLYIDIKQRKTTMIEYLFKSPLLIQIGVMKKQDVLSDGILIQAYGFDKLQKIISTRHMYTDDENIDFRVYFKTLEDAQTRYKKIKKVKGKPYDIIVREVNDAKRCGYKKNINEIRQILHDECQIVNGIKGLCETYNQLLTGFKVKRPDILDTVKQCIQRSNIILMQQSEKVQANCT